MRLALVHIVPDETTIPFVKLRLVALVLSALLMLGSIAVFFTQGLNFGIDFQGGTLIEFETEEPEPDLTEIRATLNGLGLGDVQVQTFGRPNDILVRIEEQVAGDAEESEFVDERAQQQAAQQVQTALVDLLGGVDFRRVEVVGPKVSGDLVQSGVLAVLLAVGAMLIYIWFRFEWQFSIAAIMALTHDVIATIGMFCLTGFEFNLASIAAILTIVGYSINDTVVVFDRIRENLRKYKRMPLPELINLTINQTLSRTLVTSLTTLCAVLALFFLGGQVLRGFSFAMIFGIIVGTYSSIFVASPLLLVTGVNRNSGDKEGS